MSSNKVKAVRAVHLNTISLLWFVERFYACDAYSSRSTPTPALSVVFPFQSAWNCKLREKRNTVNHLSGFYDPFTLVELFNIYMA